MPIEPDIKDWTWVLARSCPECGFDAPGLARTRVPDAIRDNATLWEVVLGTEDAAVRPSPHVWSPLEYACHVRDVNVLFAQRVRQMLTEDGPTFANWNQDRTAVEQDYGSQQPATVGAELTAAADAVAEVYAGVADDQWERTGTRSNGDRFTVDTMARYHLHDLVHHAHDVSHVTKRITVASYDAHAEAYRAGTEEMPDSVRAAMERFVAALPAGARILEVGSGPGRDARALEAAGLSTGLVGTVAPKIGARTSRPRSWRCCVPTGTGPTSWTRSPTTSRTRTATRRTTAYGPRPRCCTSGARTCRSWSAAWPTPPDPVVSCTSPSRRATGPGSPPTVTWGLPVTSRSGVRTRSARCSRSS